MPNETPDVQKEAMHTPTPTGSAPVHHNGLVLGILVIALVLILGGIYLWGSLLKDQTPSDTETPIVNNEPETTRANVDTESLEILSTSDEISAIEADINSTKLDSLETDFTAIDAEFNKPVAQ